MTLSGNRVANMPQHLEAAMSQCRNIAVLAYLVFPNASCDDAGVRSRENAAKPLAPLYPNAQALHCRQSGGVFKCGCPSRRNAGMLKPRTGGGVRADTFGRTCFGTYDSERLRFDARARVDDDDDDDDVGAPTRRVVRTLMLMATIGG